LGGEWRPGEKKEERDRGEGGSLKSTEKGMGVPRIRASLALKMSEKILKYHGYRGGDGGIYTKISEHRGTDLEKKILTKMETLTRYL